MWKLSLSCINPACWLYRPRLDGIRGIHILVSTYVLCQDLPKFQFSGGGEGGKLGTKSKNRVNWDFLTKFPTTPACLCITDSLSHTMYVETKQLKPSFDDLQWETGVLNVSTTRVYKAITHACTLWVGSSVRV